MKTFKEIREEIINLSEGKISMDTLKTRNQANRN